MKIENYTKQWYRIENRASLPSQIYIYGDIGGMGLNSADFVNDLRQMQGDLEIHINTAGGMVSDGVAIHNAIKNHAGAKTVIVDSLAASIGSVIAMAGDTVLMEPNAQMMIHEGQAVAGGDASDFRKMADVLDMNSDIIAGFYANKTGTPAAYWRQQMKNETWYNAQQAIQAGLADGIAKPLGISNVSKPHGDVEYADPGYLDADGNQASKSGKEGVARYPIDEEHVKAAWSYINQEKNASQYTSEQLGSIKDKIKAAMKKYGHDVNDDAENASILKIMSTLQEVFKL